MIFFFRAKNIYFLIDNYIENIFLLFTITRTKKKGGESENTKIL